MSGGSPAIFPTTPTPIRAADQRGKSGPESAARLARMLGRDASEAELGEWVALARYFADCQLAEIEHAARGLAERDALPRDAPVVGAGCGRFVAKALAERLGRPYLDFAEIIDAAPEAREMAARCAPAVAVALLAATTGMTLTFSSCAYSGSPRSACRCPSSQSF